jgi:hypothetical protein
VVHAFPVSAALLASLWGADTSIVEARPGLVNESSPHYDLEVLYDQGRVDEGLKQAKEELARHPEDLDLYWHTARFMFEVGERFDRTDKSIDKVGWYEEMVRLFETGLERDPTHAHLMFGLGIAKGRLGTTRGVLASLFMAKEVEAAWLAAASSPHRYSSIRGQEQLPCDAYLCLGIFYRLVPDSFIVEMIGGTRGSLDKSLANLERSDRCGPDRIGTLKELGVTQLCKGEKSKDETLVVAGRATLLRARALPPEGDTDVTDIRHIDMLLANPKLACGYSRDGQQDLDEEKLKAQEPK